MDVKGHWEKLRKEKGGLNKTGKTEATMEAQKEHRGSDG